jgi:hypothetical protein
VSLIFEPLVWLKEYLDNFEGNKLLKVVKDLLDNVIWQIDLRRKEAI